ncbi:hypothetical protein KCU91_g3036, partial [Aureobasidium melanogenum]
MPSRRLKPRRPCQRHLLPWGYDAPQKDNISLDAFIEMVTKEDDGSTSEIKNVLMYWDRNCGKQKHNLGEAAQMMEVEMTTQADLDEMIDTEREYKLGAMRHCGGGDSDLTMVVAERSTGWGLDFEGGGHTGQGTTEIGLTKLWASDLEELGQNYWSTISSRHAIILESFNDHLCRGAQEGKIAIDSRVPETYPRWNFRGGPNTTEKCAYIFQASHNTPPQVLNISIDSEIISQINMACWIIHQMPPRHNTENQVANVKFTTASLNATAYPMIVIVDSQNEPHALRLIQCQRQDPSCRSRPYKAKRRRPRVEEEDWCM